jgi:hypothetical protein
MVFAHLGGSLHSSPIMYGKQLFTEPAIQLCKVRRNAWVYVGCFGGVFRTTRFTDIGSGCWWSGGSGNIETGGYAGGTPEIAPASVVYGTGGGTLHIFFKFFWKTLKKVTHQRLTQPTA